jgi:UDP-GlcNAc:undecaprenyl-phosphate GlcNAc-1-phosphate transferase
MHLGTLGVILATSALISLVVTRAVILIAPRVGFVDKPGGHKAHAGLTPLGGGIGIVAGSIGVIVAGLLVIHFASPDVFGEGRALLDLIGGVKVQTPLILAFLAGALILFGMGLLDDRRAMGPYSKLSVQLVVISTLVVGFDVRALTALDVHVGGSWLSSLLTILWITAVTNAFNFMDNMDGLSAGCALICGTAMLVTALLVGQTFVAATLATLVGALVGFLWWNFPPARVFMGDAGSLVIGFVLGVMSVRITFVSTPDDFAAGWYAVFAPALAVAVPMYDLVVVSAIRLANGRSPFRGDRNHFSHRLVDRGMSKRTAVLCIYLVTASTSIAAIILPQVGSTLGAFLLMAQTGLVLGVVMLLEQHPGGRR